MSGYSDIRFKPVLFISLEIERNSFMMHKFTIDFTDLMIFILPYIYNFYIVRYNEIKSG
jgi:hypothetical protein